MRFAGLFDKEMVMELCHLSSIPWCKALEKQCFSTTPDCLWSWKLNGDPQEGRDEPFQRIHCRDGPQVQEMANEFVGLDAPK